MELQKILNLLDQANDSKFCDKKMEHCQWSIKCKL